MLNATAPTFICQTRKTFSTRLTSFGSMGVHSLGVLPPPTVYLAHMGDESVFAIHIQKKNSIRAQASAGAACSAPPVSALVSSTS